MKPIDADIIINNLLGGSEHEPWITREIVQLLRDQPKIETVLPFEFGQKLYSIEKWSDTGDSTIFEYEFDGVESGGLRLMYRGNKEDVCVFPYEELGINLFESRKEAEQTLEGGSESGNEKILRSN